MASRRIQNRLDQIPATTRAALMASAVVDEALRRQAPSPREAALWIGTGQMCAALGREIERRGRNMLTTDGVLDEAIGERRQLQQRRDRLARNLYKEVGDLRRRIHGVLGRRAGDEYLRFLDGATSRDPVELCRQARLCHDALTSAPPVSRMRGVVHHWDVIAESLRSSAEQLQQAVRDVYSARAAVILASGDQRQAIKDFDTIYRRGTRFLEAQLDIAGLPTLADRVRPGVGRRGRPRKVRRVDEYPDLVQKALESVLGEDPEDLVGVSETAPGTPAVEEKSEQGRRELPGGEEIIEQPLHELQMAGEKSRKALHEQPGGSRKSEQGLHEIVENAVSVSKPTIQRNRSARKRVVLGVAHRMNRRSRPVAVEKTRKMWPMREVRATASRWWQKLREAA